MTDYTAKSYGRNEEVAAIFRHFEVDRDLSMAGPRRLGKTFVLDRLVERAVANEWIAVKVEVGGCGDTRSFFRALCNSIGGAQSGGDRAISWIRQRLGQAIDPRTEPSGDWYQPFISLDHETYFERLVSALHDDKRRRWALLIDELPIFLKALHDQGPQGVDAARNFMNLLSRLRAANPRVRWMITGSIGLEPLARVGNYMGVLAKFETFHLQPLSEAEACEFVKDIAQAGRIQHRRAVSDAEANALVEAVGWRAAYYLERVAMKLSGTPCEDADGAKQVVEDAVQKLLVPGEAASFGVWEEHLRKHYRDSEAKVAFSALAALAPIPRGLSLNALLAAIGNPALTRNALREVLIRLEVEGFITISDLEGDNPEVAFLNLLLRRRWARFPPSATA
jgi:hypothetical protein